MSRRGFKPLICELPATPSKHKPVQWGWTVAQQRDFDLFKKIRQALPGASQGAIVRCVLWYHLDYEWVMQAHPTSELRPACLDYLKNEDLYLAQVKRTGSAPYLERSSADHLRLG